MTMSDLVPDDVGSLPTTMSNKAYKKEVTDLLKCTFPRLSVASIRKVYNHVNFQFLPAHAILLSIPSHVDISDFNGCVLEVVPVPPMAVH